MFTLALHIDGDSMLQKYIFTPSLLRPFKVELTLLKPWNVIKNAW